MTWWLWVVIAWTILSLPLGIVVGSLIRGPAEAQQRHDLGSAERWRLDEAA
jgi:hypothetical protein